MSKFLDVIDGRKRWLIWEGDALAGLRLFRRLHWRRDHRPALLALDAQPHVTV